MAEAEKHDSATDVDVFEQTPEHDFRYKTLSWQLVSALMIAEIVSNGMLSLPSALAVVGIVPAVVLIVFFGVFALYTAKLLIDFKLTHLSVHNMGDAGYILGGPVVRELLSAGTIIFAIAGTGSELLSGQQALSALSNNGLCSIYLLLIFAVATLLLALPRTLNQVGWLGLFSAGLITISGIVAMIGAGSNPLPGRMLSATIPTNFYQAFLAITNPVFAYAGHFMFFILISEMKRPEDAMKAAWVLQTFSTVFYAVFAVVIYVYIGNTVASPALFSLPETWSKVTFGIALLNFLIAGSLYSHTAAKILFVRWFRHSRHLYMHTVLGWAVWVTLCFAAVVVAFIFAVSVPIFSYLIGIAASLFASWYTYGIAGFFELHTTYTRKGGWVGIRQRPIHTLLALFTIAVGAFVCVAGTYVSIRLINDAYRDGILLRDTTMTTALYSVPIASRNYSPSWRQQVSAFLFCVFFNLGCITIHTTQLLVLIVFGWPWSRGLYKRGIRYTKGSFGLLLILMCQWFAPTKLRITFETKGKGKFSQEQIEEIAVKDEDGNIVALDLPKKFVLISNHQIYLDWWYAWNLTYFIGKNGIHRSVYITLKKSLQWIPVIGPAMQFYDFIFLARSWVSDRAKLSKSLSALGKAAQQEDDPFVFFIYPEGTLVSKDTRPISKKFAEKTGIDDMTNVLLPRSTGLHYSLRSLSPRIRDLKLIDITTVYPGIPPLRYGQDYYTLRSVFLHRMPPPVIHMHLRMFDVASEVPIGDLSRTNSAVLPDSKAPVEVEIPDREKSVFDVWLRELWQEKDESITRWFNTSSFDNFHLDIPLRLRTKREVLDAFAFFIPSGVQYLWTTIRGH
ncbi:putative acyltransferase CST26 [Mycena indigotica]|uniref:Putative acyltransferase CST26 n=1 Tax=Mycena indigotica TaxID=2126181 RepID=A0A8H6SZD9_9AGAR|nr:putative acyltransferase CST26 [Mycena indigotica]KAF7306685.1 putative acyltransferase CST26 [Mycena indigotica]